VHWTKGIPVHSTPSILLLNCILTSATMGMASKRNRDRLLMVGAAAAAVSAVAFYFAWKAFRAAADPDDKNEDGEKELQDLEKLMKANEEKGAEVAGVNSYLEEQDGFTVEEFEQFVAQEYGKPQAEVTVDPPSNLIEEEEFAVEDSIKTEEEEHGESGGKFEDSEIPCDGFFEGTHLCLTSPSDEVERLSMENEFQGDNHSVNLICSGPCIGRDVCDSGITETIHGISNAIPDDLNPLCGDFEGFSSSNPETPLGQVEFDNSSYSYGIQGISSGDFVAELCSSEDVGYDELSTQKVVVFLGNGVQASDLENQSKVQNASEFNQTGIEDKGMRCEGPVIELSDFNDVGELAEHLSDDGQHHIHKVAESEEPSDVGIALENEFDSSVNKGIESFGPREGLDAESSNSSDEGDNVYPSDDCSEYLTAGSSEHADCGIAMVCSEKPLDGQIIRLPEPGNMSNNEKTECLSLISLVTKASSSVDNICDELSSQVLEEGITSPIAVDFDRRLLDDSLKSVSIETGDYAGGQIAADFEKSLDGRTVLQRELDNIGNNEMEDLKSVGPVTEASYSAYNGSDELSSRQLEDGMPSLAATASAPLDCENDTDLGKHLDRENDTDLGKDTDGQIAPEIGFDNIINSYNECSGIDSSGHPGHQDPGELGKDKTHLDYEHDPVLGKDTDGEITPKLDFDNIINSNSDCSDRDSSDSPGHQYPAESGNDRTHLDCENVPDLGKDTHGEITPALGLDNIINSDSKCSDIDSSEHPGDQDRAESGKDRTEQLQLKLNFDSSTNNNNTEDLSLEDLDTQSYNSGNRVFDQLLTNLSEDVQKSNAEISLHPEVDSLNINNHAVEESRSNSPGTQSSSCGDMGCDSLSGHVFEDTLKSSTVSINGQFDPPISTDLGKQCNEQTALLETLDNERNGNATESLNLEELMSQLPSFRHMGSDEFSEHLLGVMRSSSVANDTTGDSEKNFGRLNAYDKYLADPSLSPSMKSQVSRARAIAEKLYESSEM